MKEQIEAAIIDCNYVIKRWMATRPNLLDYANVRGLVTHFLKRVINRNLGWRSARGFFDQRVMYIDVNTEKGYIKSIEISTAVEKTIDANRVTLAQILTSLDYEMLNLRSMDKHPAYMTDIDQLSFKSLELINF